MAPVEIARSVGSPRPGVLALLLVGVVLLQLPGCGPDEWVPVPEAEGVMKSSSERRAALRLYDGAPPVIPHGDFGAGCGACHDKDGSPLPGVGFAPPSPHFDTEQAGSTTRCRQCHVQVLDRGLFEENGFVGLRQDLRFGTRLYDGAPPTIPHKVFMRENCQACHVGPGARPGILTTHPERTRCTQCHVPILSQDSPLLYDEVGVNAPEGS